MITICGTGHRPDKLGGYGEEAGARLYGLAYGQLDAMLSVSREEITVISGMALGWDMALARAAAVLNIPWIAAVPFIGQESAWPMETQERYHQLLATASRTVVVSPGGYSSVKMQLRNQWMVNNSDIVLAVWDGSEGGTRNCIKYAEKCGKPTYNLYHAGLK